MNTNDNNPLSVSAPTLPKGGGAIKGMGEALGSVGMSGLASMSLPLPISPGRGYGPSLALNYSSGAGSTEFGLGWGMSTLAIRRRTSSGVPAYQEDDSFLAPSGEVLVAEVDALGQVVATTVTIYNGLTLDQAYRVTRYFPCIEGDFSRIERWQPADSSGDFWLIHAPDGQLLCLGRTAQARIADPAAPTTRIGAWLIEESVNLNGEHVCYRYAAENTQGVNMAGAEAARVHTSNRYLTQVQYGNKAPYAPLYAWAQYSENDTPSWLFTLVFDYGERTLDRQSPPPWQPTGAWLCRQDAFSDYAFGFEVRTHRLCHQVLMFHHFPSELGQQQTLISRLLLGYKQNPQLTQLIGAQSLAYAPDDSLLTLPPLALTYTPFMSDFAADHYQQLPAFPSLNDGVQYQLVDLFGEGLPGILYQVDNDWRYQAPQRGVNGPDAIAYGPWQPLPNVPSLLPTERGRQALMDLTGDGRLDWVIAQPNLHGFFTLHADKSWSTFVPFAAFPVEFLQSNARLVDLMGAGLSDLALIGPQSVRVYANKRDQGFAPPLQVLRDSPDRLPQATGDQAAAVVLSDVLGSGQQHLVRITCDQITCWPNLGRGHFGLPLHLADLPFDAHTFNPDRVFLADLDGSGAADLIYAESEHFTVFFNQCGNGFAAPTTLPMPDGVRFDQLSQVNFADLNGLGMASLVLTVPYLQPSHWVYHFAAHKPYLLQSSTNHQGSYSSLEYRSSAQEWLDEKQANPHSVCELPMALPLVARVISVDEISGNQLIQQYRYRRGVYAGHEREFRGFGLVEHLDTHVQAVASATDLPVAPPALTRVWYHTGQEGTEQHPGILPYQDPALFALGATRLTRLDSQRGEDVLLTDLDEASRYQLFRALKGQVLRQELYGADESSMASVPYSVSSSRFQVRWLQAAPEGKEHAVVLPLVLEQLNVTYERINADPQVQQQVELRHDAYGVVTWGVSINYPRRPQPTSNPYPATVIDAVWANSYDTAQQPLRLAETRVAVHHLTAPTVWRLALPSQQRQNVLTYTSGYTDYPLNAQGLSYEALHAPAGWLSPTRTRVLAGQTQTYYFDAAGTAALPPGALPPPLALVHHQEVAALDETALDAYVDVPNLTDLEDKLIAGGYVERPLFLNEVGAAPQQVWVIPSGFTTYVEQGAWLPFYRPRATRSTALMAPINLTYDPYYCLTTRITDGLGNRIKADYDYRFLVPWRTIDPNDNTQEVLFDALGRVVASSFYGTEMDENDTVVDVGFAPISAFDPSVPELRSIEAALAHPLAAIQGAAGVYLYEFDNWAQAQTPVQVAVLQADQYPGHPEVQVQIALSFQDGFGRALQSKQLCPPGLAYVVTPEGSLELENGQPVERDTGTGARWAVSGRVEYDNKGQVVRTYQPYFVDSTAYLKDDQAREWGYADTHFYDPLGREYTVITALGYWRRASHYPWFSIAEDENDTLNEVLARQRQSVPALPS